MIKTLHKFINVWEIKKDLLEFEKQKKSILLELDINEQNIRFFEKQIKNCKTKLEEIDAKIKLGKHILYK